MLSDILLSAVMMSVHKPGSIILSVLMLSVIMGNVVVSNVVAFIGDSRDSRLNLNDEMEQQ